MRGTAIRVLIADDQSLFAENLATFLQNYAEDIEVVGIAPNGKAASELAAKLSPDVVLMDVFMPVLNGVEATRLILADNPEVKILILSTYDQDEYVRQALKFGAAGYLLKDISPTELIASVRALGNGLIQISPSLVQQLVQEMHHDPIGDAKPLPEKIKWYRTLTEREKEVFSLIATGCENNQIAQTLHVSEHSVRNYVSRIYSKLEVQNRFQIIQLANRISLHK